MNLYHIFNKGNGEMCSRYLYAHQVHYLFIEKGWDKANCIIICNVGHRMSYGKFSKLYPL